MQGDLLGTIGRALRFHATLHRVIGKREGSLEPPRFHPNLTSGGGLANIGAYSIYVITPSAL